MTSAVRPHAPRAALMAAVAARALWGTLGGAGARGGVRGFVGGARIGVGSPCGGAASGSDVSGDRADSKLNRAGSSGGDGSEATTTTAAAVGFIGLGNMGASMAANVLRKGFRLTVFDSNAAAMAPLVDGGAQPAESPADVAEKSDVIITMLPSPPIVLQVYTGPLGVLAGGRQLRPHLLIDASTVDPATCHALATAASSCHVDPSKASSGAPSGPPLVVDAPVSGGVGGAKAGTLTFMVGGSPAAFSLASPLLAAMGAASIHCGGTGAGAAAKLCNNAALAIEMAAVAEASAMAQRLGLDPRLMAAVLNRSSARCWSSECYHPVPGVMGGVPADRDYKGGFSNALMAKDLHLAVAAAQTAGASAPLASTVMAMYRDMIAHGAASDDFSSVYKHMYGGRHADAPTPRA
eukprot:TRINITY_DN5356_c0_g1_i1.p1 TRINITY_DN5356_c0_g1~~TRINITY_DN5356_c0_g1_i1.p1  ORF type:complete len:408 (+),score=4.66 TRINITY_DN5356_c0_g1_i1:417-1640(+)